MVLVLATEYDRRVLSLRILDDLSNKVNDIKVGCTIGATLINHLMYVDD